MTATMQLKQDAAKIAVMNADPLAVPKFMPYRPTTDFPFFGQPQQ